MGRCGPCWNRTSAVVSQPCSDRNVLTGSGDLAVANGKILDNHPVGVVGMATSCLRSHHVDRHRVLTRYPISLRRPGDFTLTRARSRSLDRALVEARNAQPPAGNARFLRQRHAMG